MEQGTSKLPDETYGLVKLFFVRSADSHASSKSENAVREWVVLGDEFYVGTILSRTFPNVFMSIIGNKGSRRYFGTDAEALEKVVKDRDVGTVAVEFQAQVVVAVGTKVGGIKPPKARRGSKVGFEEPDARQLSISIGIRGEGADESVWVLYFGVVAAGHVIEAFDHVVNDASLGKVILNVADSFIMVHGIGKSVRHIRGRVHGTMSRQYFGKTTEVFHVFKPIMLSDFRLLIHKAKQEINELQDGPLFMHELDCVSLWKALGFSVYGSMLDGNYNKLGVAVSV